MTYVMFACFLVALEAYRFVSGRSGFVQPKTLTIGIPLVLALGTMKVARPERLALMMLAVTLELALNRSLLPNWIVAEALILPCAALTIWSGLKVRSKGGNLRALAISVAVVLLTFVAVWTVGAL